MQIEQSVDCFQREVDYFLEVTKIYYAICSANHWTGFYMVTASVMKELRK